MTGRFVPVIPRDLRLEVPERMDARGRVLTAARRGGGAAPPSRRCWPRAASRWSSISCTPTPIPAHERRAAAIAAEIWPNASITLGHALLSESREYERGVTAAVNAAVRPLLERYVARLQGELRQRAASGARCW